MKYLDEGILFTVFFSNGQVSLTFLMSIPTEENNAALFNVHGVL